MTCALGYGLVKRGMAVAVRANCGWRPATPQARKRARGELLECAADPAGAQTVGTTARDAPDPAATVGGALFLTTGLGSVFAAPPLAARD